MAGGLWWCTHEDENGRRMTVLHTGHQCTPGDEEDDCTLYQKGWKFISCRRADLAEERGHVVIVDLDRESDRRR